MFIRKKYDYLSPALDKSIYELTPAEAEAHFDWYMKKLPERVAYVSRVAPGSCTSGPSAWICRRNR